MQGLRDEALLRVVCERLGTTPHELPNSAAVRYILHFAMSTDNADEVVRRLHRRRQFELSLPLVTITPASVLCLRSGAFHIWTAGDAFSRPILFVRPALIPSMCRDGWMSTTEGTSELEIVALLVLEYLQYIATRKQQLGVVRSSSSSTVGATASAASGSASHHHVGGGSSNISGSGSGAAISITVPALRQESGMDCAILVDTTEPDAAWIRDQTDRSFVTILSTLALKYYPGLVSACWILVPPSSMNPSNRNQNNANDNSSNKHSSSTVYSRKLIPSGFEQIVRFVSLRDLPSIIDVNALPRRLGGRQSDLPNVASSVVCSDILRVWFSLTTLLLQEQQQGNIGVVSTSSQASRTNTNTGNNDMQRKDTASNKSATSSSNNNPNKNVAGNSSSYRPVWMPLCLKLLQLERSEILLLGTSSSTGISPQQQNLAFQKQQRQQQQQQILLGASSPSKRGGNTTTILLEGSEPGNDDDYTNEDDDDESDGKCSEITSAPNSSSAVQQNYNNSSGNFSDENNNSLTTSQVLQQQGTITTPAGGIQYQQQVFGDQQQQSIITAAMTTQDAATVLALSRQLELEKRCRAQLEAQVQRLTLGVTFEGDRAACALVGTLRGCHEEANVLVADAITKSVARSKMLGPGAPSPSLTELFDNFERELSSVLGTDTEGSAPLPSYLLRAADVVTRPPPESSSCVIC